VSHRTGFGGWLKFLWIKDSIKQRSDSDMLLTDEEDNKIYIKNVADSYPS